MKTVSAGGIILNSGKIVVVQQGGKSWSFPKGHVEKGETPLAAAKREIYEETGLKDLTFIREFSSYARRGSHREMKTIHLFLFRTEEKALRPRDRIITEAKWVEKDKVADTLTNKTDKEFFLGVVNEIQFTQP